VGRSERSGRLSLSRNSASCKGATLSPLSPLSPSYKGAILATGFRRFVRIVVSRRLGPR
jgi:hypothetical protein